MSQHWMKINYILKECKNFIMSLITFVTVIVNTRSMTMNVLGTWQCVKVFRNKKLCQPYEKDDRTVKTRRTEGREEIKG